jgi:beta-lactamase superfamily II metal-dependent hydrolase
MSRCFLALTATLFFCGATPAGEPLGLKIYFVDTEGGAATLIVTPARESVLIDCGNPGGRDAERISDACKRAGLKAIDHLVITHWHLDHYGSVDGLAKRLPIHHFYDRGIPPALEEDPKNFPLLIQAYRAAGGSKSHTLKAGDVIDLKGAPDTPTPRLLCLCGNQETIPDRSGAPENAAAREHKPQPKDPSDNAKSLGFLLSYGDFRFLDLGDLTWNVEYKLVHPTNKIGLVDVYLTTHHGLDISNNPVVINSVIPRVAIFNNGPRKGAAPSVTATLRRVPGLQAIYQLHRNVTVGAQENTDPEFIANPDEECRGEPITLGVAPNGKSYAIRVGSKGKPRRYETRGPQD